MNESIDIYNQTEKNIDAEVGDDMAYVFQIPSMASFHIYAFSSMVYTVYTDDADAGYSF